MSPIRTVFLDVGWTLAYPRRSIWRIFADIARQAGSDLSAGEPEALVRQLWRSGQDAAVERYHSGASYTDSDEEFASLFRQMGALVFAHFRVPGDHAVLTQHFLEEFWTAENWALFSDVHETIDHLRRRGLRVGVLSNAPSNLPDFLERLGIARHLDFTVVSALEGVKKPDRRIFQAALSRAGVAPQEALHVGDMYVEDILGGRGAGVHTLLIERGPCSLFPSYRESEGRSLDPADVVGSLHEVLERVC